jgi:hypothetical protein
MPLFCWLCMRSLYEKVERDEYALENNLVSPHLTVAIPYKSEQSIAVLS